MIRLGNLKTTNENIIKEYPMISLEYRYLKDPKKKKKIMIIMWFLKNIRTKQRFS